MNATVASCLTSLVPTAEQMVFQWSVNQPGTLQNLATPVVLDPLSSQTRTLLVGADQLQSWLHLCVHLQGLYACDPYTFQYSHYQCDCECSSPRQCANQRGPNTNAPTVIPIATDSYL